eukprot:TRINITY_DN30_c0_g1_i16.p5 TRINITY_DN30_c0_g1~~TRINITY_DN30_c0_g1_i16.p5  ORF type:complete len:121 (-),score=38.36 TRINITY_DN30_c0_g1_i16:301-663(-)
MADDAADAVEEEADADTGLDGPSSRTSSGHKYCTRYRYCYTYRVRSYYPCHRRYTHRLLEAEGPVADAAAPEAPASRTAADGAAANGEGEGAAAAASRTYRKYYKCTKRKCVWKTRCRYH